MLNVKLAVQISFNVLYGNKRFFHSSTQNKKDTLCGQEVEFFNLNVVVYIVTNGL